MSTSSTSSSSSSSSSSSTGYLLSSLGSGAAEQITGLASGLNTDQIIQEEMSIYEQPVTNLQNQSTNLTAQNTALTNIQTQLQTLASDAQALGDPSLFNTSQAVTSSDTTRVQATSSTGAGVGGYQVSVSQLANSAQRTFAYTSPTSADTVSIDGQQVSVSAGESISSFVNAINSNSNLDVYAAATDSGTVVLSNRSTGDTGTNFIQVQDSGGTLNEDMASFTYTSPTSADTVTINGQQVSVSAGESAANFVSAINANSSLNVNASVNSSGQVVLSNRAGGTGGSVSVQDSGGTLTNQTSLAKEGQNALYSVDGVSGSSASNTVTGAIAGVSLTLAGVTTTSGPVTVDVGAPAASASNISSAVQTFITQYNSVISSIESALTTAPTSGTAGTGTLYQDPELQDLLTSMRSAMYTSGSGLPSGLANMLDIGVSTGATTGSGAESQSALAGDLTLDSTTLSNELSSNAVGVQNVLSKWADSFSTMVNDAADPGGTIDTRISGDTAEVTQLGNQISAMQATLTDKQNSLVQEYAQLESALSTNQSTSSWLTSQIAQLA